MDIWGWVPWEQVGKPWENHGETRGRPNLGNGGKLIWENVWRIFNKMWEHVEKTMEKPMEKPW